MQRFLNPESRILIPFILCLCLQFGFWQQTRDMKPELGIVPDVPGKQEVQILTFGDDEFYFRTLAFIIQNCGDTYGRFSPLRYYDLNKLYYWWELLDGLDARSNTMPMLAANYFSQTQNTPDVRYIVDYLYAHSIRDVGRNWWWLLQAIYLAQYKLHDMNLAVKMAKPLVNDKVPVWAQQMAAVIYEKGGEMEEAMQIIDTIKAHARNISDADLRYMTYFVKERLNALDNMGRRVRNNAPAPRDVISPAPPLP